MDEIENLRRLLQEEQHRRQQAEGDAAEQRRRREVAEELAKGSLPQTLPQYLDSCHSLSLQIRVVTDPSSTTQGDTTNPVGRIFPRRIIPWEEFAAGQEEAWEKLSVGSPFSSQAAFPSSHQLDYVASVMHPISSETDLRHFELVTVEHAVKKLVDEAYNDLLVRARLGIRGSVTFESHTNLGNDAVDAVSTSVEHMSIGGNRAAGAATLDIVRAFRRAVGGNGGSADQFCIYRTSDGPNVPALAIEYKAPHKLTRDEVVTGLSSEIQPERDVINRDGEDFAFASRSLVAAVITQLFSYMIAKGIRYGYVCTGETFVFLHIPDDPSVVYYFVSVPNLDVLDDDENRLHRTAVAQVFAFVLRALQAPPPPASWYDRAMATLETWAVEYEDVLKKIPQSVRKEHRVSPYKPQRWRGFVRSPIRTRSSCRPPGGSRHEKEDDGSEEDGLPPSPSLGRPARTRGNGLASTSAADRNQRQLSSEDNPPHDNKKRAPASICIEDRLYCTHECLSGLAGGGPIDWECPNAADHGDQHLNPSDFRRLIRVQLAQDRGSEADAAPLYISGAIGSLFKVRLSAYGYTLIAKGVEGRHLARLRHENKMYSRLQSIQGKHIPVCLGTIDLIIPYYYNGGVFEHFMFVSWAGNPLSEVAKTALIKTVVIDEVAAAFKAIHALQVLHGDAELRNVLYDVSNSNVMVVDFERAIVYNRRPLSSISPNRKRKYDYPITPSFDHWRFPHATPNPNTDEQISSDLPRAWREVSIPRYHPRGDFKPDRPTIMQRDGTCRATDHITGLEVAHLVPNKASAWFRRNKMQSYALRPNDKEPWNDIQNKILLRADIHIMLDRKEIVPMPKKIDGQYRFVIKVIKGNEFHSYDTYELYHNRIFLEFRGIQPEYLFSRFAWNIFDVDILQVLSTARLRRAVHIFDPTDNIYKIEERYVSEFKVSRSQSANGNESSKRRRASAGPAECDSSDETLTSVSSESDSEEREEYEKRLCSLDVAQEQRGRKRTRSGDRFSDASTDVGSNVSMRHTAKTRMV
ncbi:hypothetical protein GGR53DRAFT_465612 [Hypoxylon sp. FL1150]|nr:hypothetical protein GGR53DRAFT_465612 [Hypoxylon sp. FL1150]